MRNFGDLCGKWVVTVQDLKGEFLVKDALLFFELNGEEWEENEYGHLA